MSYRPLPDVVTVINSPIDGLGLFAAKPISAGYELGISHVKDERFENGYIRTPLGGFYNHSEDPNCEAYIDDPLGPGLGVIRLRTIKDVSAGEELTGKYWLYDLDA
jgi:SET domain-containing protein